MNTTRKSILIVIFFAILMMLAVPAFAQEATRTITRTEAQINSSYRVTNPRLRSVSNVSVDLQPGQAVISATLTFRRGEPLEVIATLVPTLTNGRIYWTVTSATVNGQPASAELLAQINASITSSWRNYIRQQAPTGRVTAIEITDNAITVTLTGR
jgi:hypothetical protein